jgi:hypothetical protein
MAGATSGNAICTPPAVAGTTSNPVVCSNAHSFPGVTSNVANVINVKAPPYNAVGDAQYIADATSSSSTGVVTSATANFQSTDVGKKIYCTRSDTNTAVFSPAITTIASYQSATQVTASVNGGATLSNNMCVWATQDDTSAITAAVTAAKSATAAYDPAIGARPTTVPQAQTVYIPQGGYLVTGYIYQFLGTATGQVCPSLIGGDWSKTTIYIPGSGFTANSSGYGSVIDFDNCSGFRLGNFTINGLESKPGSLVGGQDNVRINNANRFTVENLEIQNLGGTNGANLDVENSQAGILRNVWIQGSSVAGHTAYQAYYSGDSLILTEGFTFSNPNSGQSLFITTSNGGAPISGHLSFVGGVVDECTNTTACTEITSSYVDFSDMTIWAGHQQTKGALYVTGNSQLRANSISVGEYNASISQIGMQIDSGSTVYLAESIIWGGGSSTVAMVNNGNFVDVGGNIFENCPSGSCTIATSAQMNSGTGSYFGTGSITGVAQTSGNLVLTSGWGSGAAAGTISGNTKLQQFTLTAAGTPGASPVLTVTFPSPYYVAPICTLTQTAGTNFTDITLPISSSVGATGVTWTFTGTPVAAHTYTFVESCDIS